LKITCINIPSSSNDLPYIDTVEDVTVYNYPLLTELELRWQTTHTRLLIVIDK